MAKGRVDSVYNLPSIEKEQAALFKILDDLETKIEFISNTKITIAGADTFKDFSTATKEYNAYIAKTDSLIKKLQESEANLAVLRQKESVQLAENKIKLRELNKIQTERIKLANAEEGSIEQLSLKYDKAYRVYKQLSEAQRNTDRGQALNKFLEETNVKLKALEGSVGNFRRNVGNYAGSLAKPFETLATKLEELKANLKNGIGIGGKSDVTSLQQTAQAITIIETALTNSQAAGTTSVKQVKNLSNAYRDLSVTLGKSDGTTFLSTLSVEVGEAKDTVADLNDELKLQASDTKGIDNIVGSLNALAGVAQGAAGAYALFGASEEDAEKVTSKLIAVQGIANSIQQVGAELTKKGTFANRIYEASMNALSVAFARGSTAGARFGAIMKLIGGAALIITIGLLVSKFIEMSNATNDAQEGLKEYGEGVKDATIQLNKVKSAFDQAREGVVSKDEALKTYNETLGDAFGKTKSLEEAERLYNEKADVYIRIMGLKAQANALFAASAQEAANGVTAATEDQTGFLDKTKGFFLTYFGQYSKASTGAIKAQESGIEAAQEKAQLKSDKLLAKGNELAAQALALQKAFDIKTDVKTPDEKKDNKPKKISDNTAEQILKEGFETRKIFVQRELDLNRLILDDDTKTFDQRLDAAKQFLAQNIILQNIATHEELANEELRLTKVKEALLEQAKEKGADKKAINEQIAKEEYASSVVIENIILRGQDKVVKATEDFNKDLKRLKDERQKITDEEQKKIDEANSKVLKAKKKYYNDLLELYKKNQKEQEDLDKKFREEFKDAVIKAGEELQATVLFFLTAGIDKENAALENRKRLLDEETARRINQIELLGLTEEERVKKTAEVNKQAQFEKEQIERRQRQLAVQRAKFEKAASILSIISSTAQAVVGALAQVKTIGPAAYGLAALVGAIGALQLARAIAAPIPQYFKGTDSAKKGIALVSEQGSELMKKDGQYFLTPPKPTLMEMAGGEQITPAGLTNDILRSIAFTKQMREGGLTALQPVGMSANQAESLITEMKGMRGDMSKTRILIQNEHGIESTPYYINNIKSSRP